MATIPVMTKPYPDELLYSWLHRLASLNGLYFYNFMSAYVMNSQTSAKTVFPFDIRNGFDIFYKNAQLDVDEASLYLQMSTLSYECLAMEEGAQSKVVSNVFYPFDLINTPANTFIDKVNVCPDCLKEDSTIYGEPYLHRAHQLSGVCRCHKHGTILKRYIGASNNKAFSFNLDDYSDIEPCLEFDYSQFAYDLLNANINTNFKKIKEVLKSNYITLNSRVSTGDLLNYLYVLCNGDVKALNKILEIKEEPFISSDYTLQNQTSILNTYSCNASKSTFVNTSYGFKIGWRDLDDITKMSKQERVSKMIYQAGNSEYELVSQFVSMNKPVAIKHVCGRVNKIKPREFLYEGNRCPCKNVIFEDEAAKQIESLGPYRLIEFTKAEIPVKIQSLSCGHTFTTRYRKFINSPNCRICYAGPPVVTTEDARERINKVSNGEYELVGEYTNSRTEVEILHKGCGKVFKCRLNKFVDKKKKCPYCDKGNETLWDRGYEKLVEYKNNFGIVDVPKNLTFNGYHLGRWCLQQKIYYNKGELLQHRVDKLKSIGFAFNPLEEEWNRRYEQYKRYVSENKTLYVPKQTVYEGENLGAWILTQKHRFKVGKLSEERIKKLETIDKDIFKSKKIKVKL